MRPETVRRVMLGAALGAVCLGVLVLVVYGAVQAVYMARLASLNREVYQVIQEPAGRDTSAGPYARGKLVVVDRNRRELDELHRAVPAARRATNVNEVGTVVWLEWGHEWNKQGLRYPVCKVTVIDRARNVIVGEATFEGQPPSNMGNRGLRNLPAEHRPNAEVANFINHLPRK